MLATMPSRPGYDMYRTFRPVSITGGDTFDLSGLAWSNARRA
jgi:hypothetical protein